MMMNVKMEVLWKSDIPIESIEAQAVICLVSEAEWITGHFPAEWKEAIASVKERGLFQGSENQLFTIPVMQSDTAITLILVGTGQYPFTPEGLRLAAVRAAKTAVKICADQVVFALPSSMLTYSLSQDIAVVAHTLTEGFILGTYRRKTYKRTQVAYTGPDRLIFHQDKVYQDEHERQWHIGMERGRAFAEGTILARDLTNLPGNMLVPHDLANAAVRLAEQHGLEYEVLDENEIVKKGMGGLLSVGAGSVNPPRMIVLKYQGKTSWEGEIIGLVGKGITFDTGGISLKPRVGMEEMISDMAGAAVVLGALHTLCLLRPEQNVVVVIPSAENMPSGSAFKPGDIITTLSRRTVEILNTDAEGRLVLADGLTYAKELGATRIIDVATLTGAVVSALGDVATGAVSNDDPFMNEFILASKRTGEKVWPLPAYPEFEEMLRSEVADLRNSTGRYGASITAGLFIGTFAEGMPWIHLDIAGTAYVSKERGIHPKGATGAMVRTIAEYVTNA
ncbi:leucyl aminopeptidase [Paenibacillus shunpengii]|uniref:Probable cytosol aminopeptidase n=1 Tax=Paenibacillus shunpengii TaxID=2054424 RepID=A0ABW5SKP0_9BACL|nr:MULTISPECIES: leucyl aminopeptidase [unclassified Paenibacillus]SDW31743.1 leucyl aminopeptidase [Paenibacillus sp. PDC88]